MQIKHAIILLLIVLMHCGPANQINTRVSIGLRNNIDSFNINNINFGVFDENGVQYPLDLYDTTPFDGKQGKAWRYTGPKSVSYGKLLIKLNISYSKDSIAEIQLDSVSLSADYCVSYVLWLSNWQIYSSQSIKLPIGRYTNNNKDTLFGSRDISSLLRM